MHPGSVLPMPDSLLSTVVPASTIIAANEEGKKVISTDANKENTACVLRTSTILRKGLHLEKGSRAWCNSDRTILSKAFPGRPLKDSSVQTWKKKYEVELAKNKKAGS